MMAGYWIVKTEPTSYSFDRLVEDGSTRWDGVRNALAVKHIARMRQGDSVLVYHSGKEKAVVGEARVSSTPYPDPAASDPKLLVVDIEAGKSLRRPVALETLKQDAVFADLALVRMPRLSVMPASKAQWERIRRLGGR